MLEATCAHDTTMHIIEHYLEDVWITLFPLVCTDMSTSTAPAELQADTKNRAEVLRCFNVTGVSKTK
jgi:hypothetical protein